MATVMVKAILLILLCIYFSLYGCENKDPNAVELSVDFSWDGYTACDMGLPQMSIGNLPENTKILEISMYDHKFGFDHGKVHIEYNGSGDIAKGSYKDIKGPCPPPNDPGRYRITVKALDANNVVMGIGRKERYFPEEK